MKRIVQTKSDKRIYVDLLKITTVEISSQYINFNYLNNSRFFVFIIIYPPTKLNDRCTVTLPSALSFCDALHIVRTL